MKPTLEFIGAAGTVTGSRTLLRYDNKIYLIDCGLFQGSKELKERNWEAFPIPPSHISAVILTHAHIDHTGYLPRLVKQGFRGAIYCSPGTADLTRILLMDAAHLQEEDAKFANTTGHSKHKPAEALFDRQDAERALELLRQQDRDEWVMLTRDLSFRFVRSGHIIGSSFIQFNLEYDHHSRSICFSGDLGTSRSSILRGPEAINEGELLVLESTYGNRKHEVDPHFERLAEILNKTYARKGVVIIPAFAVGRSQELLFAIAELERAGKIPVAPVILDSPLASKATEIFLKHSEDHTFDRPFSASKAEFFPKMFETSETPDDSMLACTRDGPLTVIAGAGMLTGGRVLHHLKHRLPDEKNTVIFVGYQAEGSKGDYLKSNAKTAGSLRIHHQEVPIEAEIESLEHLTAHADQDEMMTWLERFRDRPKKILLNHGSLASGTSLKERIERELGIATELVVEGKTYELPPL